MKKLYNLSLELIACMAMLTGMLCLLATIFYVYDDLSAKFAWAFGTLFFICLGIVVSFTKNNQRKEGKHETVINNHGSRA